MLVLSAAGRHLAVDLAEKHDAGALDIVEQMLAGAGSQTDEREVLITARRALLKVQPMMSDCGPYRDEVRH